MNFLGGEELPKVCSKSVRRTQPELQTTLLVQYTNAMADIVNQLNINVDATGGMFERRTPPSLEIVNFMGGKELPKVCFRSVR